MAQYQHPGVYVQESPSTGSISAAHIDIPLFIGTAANSAHQGKSTLITNWNDYQQTFGSFAWETGLPNAVLAFFNEGGTRCYVLNAKPDPKSPPIAASGSIGVLAFSAASTGKWGNRLHVHMTSDSSTSSGPPFNVQILAEALKRDDQSKDPNKQSGADLRLATFLTMNKLEPQTFDETSYYALETYCGITSTNDLVSRINATSNFIRVIANETSNEPLEQGSIHLNGGLNGSWGLANEETKAEAEKLQDFSLLAIPDNVLQDDLTIQRSNLNFWLEAAANSARPFFVVADAPYAMTPQQVLNFKQGHPTDPGLQSSYGALYYPWLRFFNPSNNAVNIMPPSGTVLGRIADTDNAVGPWQAPAGVKYGHLQFASEVDYKANDQENQTLNAAGVNCIRAIPNYGISIWGARTLSLDPEWTYINVRRLITFLEVSLNAGLKWAIFEPSSAQLWQKVINETSAFLTKIWQEGALVGAKATEAFFVICDQSNNPPEAIEAGTLLVTIGVAVVHPAEFLILNLQMKTRTEST